MKRGRRPSELGCVGWVRTPPRAQVHSPGQAAYWGAERAGGAPHGGAVVPREAPRWEGPASGPQGGRDVLEKLRGRVRGRAAPRGSGGSGVPKAVPARRSAVGPYAERRPLARGRRTEAGAERPEEGGGLQRGAPRRDPWSGAPWRGGGEAGKGPGSYLPGSRR